MSTAFGTTLWGLFCACSWTWCIGMYLPLIVLDRFGWAGVLAFAVPNVAGCALFGYVLRTPRRSAALAARHAPAVAWFSAVTVIFHLFFVTFVTARLLPEAWGPGLRSPWLPAAAPLALLGVGLLLSHLGDRAWLGLAGSVFAVSLAALAAVLCAAGPGDGESVPPVPFAADVVDLLCVAPVLVFGFLLCPYLDGTFHRALRRSPSRHAFGVFGVAFAVMIVLTCAYGAGGGRPPGIVLLPLVAAHLGFQSLFTVGAHLRELRGIDGAPRAAWIAVALAVVALPVAMLGGGPGAVPGESGYLRFLVFYGLVFPAYAMLFVGPGRVPAPTARPLAILLALVGLSLPAYELGFLHGREWLLPIPVTALLIWKLTRHRAGTPALGSSGSRAEAAWTPPERS